MRTQQLLVVVFILLVYFHGFQAGAPRTDQVGYLHQVSQFTTLRDIILHAPDWNRTQSAGDFVLYRPVLYLLLGLEYGLFGYDFTLWQGLAITLHILTALVLLALLWKTVLRGTVWPLGITCLFASSLLGSELVIWNHITGYVLFALMACCSVYALVCFLESGRTVWAVLSTLTAAVAMFTYEVAGVYCVMAAAVLFVRAVQGNERRKAAVPGAVFLLLPALYVVVSVVDYQATVSVSGANAIPATGGRYGEGLRHTVYLLWYWAVALASPAAVKIGVYGRAMLTGIRRGWGITHLMNYLSLLLIGFGAGATILSRRYRPTGRGYLRAALALAFLAAYAGIIAFGRSLDRGIQYVVTANIYYSYIPVLAGCVGVALFLLDMQPPGGREVSAGIRGFGPQALAAGLTGLILLNALATYRLCWQYRVLYSEPRLSLLDNIGNWKEHQGAQANAFFTVSGDCAFANDPLPWFAGHVRRGDQQRWHGPFYWADVLFPEKSFVLNQARIQDRAPVVSRIPCRFFSTGKVEEETIEGSWEIPGGAAHCSIAQEKAGLVLINENGNRATGALDRDRIRTSWGVEGRLSATQASILWDNGTVWFRP